jgi:hypothetical protein
LPRKRPRIMASAMLPAPTNPIDFFAVIGVSLSPHPT